MLTRMTRMARMLTRMTRWLAYYTHSFSPNNGCWRNTEKVRTVLDVIITDNGSQKTMQYSVAV